MGPGRGRRIILAYSYFLCTLRVDGHLIMVLRPTGVLGWGERVKIWDLGLIGMMSLVPSALASKNFVCNSNHSQDRFSVLSIATSSILTRGLGYLIRGLLLVDVFVNAIGGIRSVRICLRNETSSVIGGLFMLNGE